MQERLDGILDEIRSAWRFRRWALVAAWVICVAGWLFVLRMPDLYEANARVFVDPSTALKPVIKGLAIEQDVNAELNLVRQSLLSEPQLRRVVQQVGLGLNAVTPTQTRDTIDQLRKRIEVTVIGGGLGPDMNSAPSKVYAIRYLDVARERSLKVVDILLNNFVEQTLSGKRDASESAKKFLSAQIKDYEKRLGEAEQRLAEFKKDNVGLVPGEHQSDYFSRLQTEMDAVKTAQTTLNLALTRREALRGQLRGEAPVAAAAMSTGPGGGAAAGDTLSRIKETQARLDDLLLRFTNKHPDVVAARETLEQLKERRVMEVEALRRGDANAAAVTGASSSPVYQSIQLALNQVEIEVAAAHGELREHQGKVADLRRMVDTMPQVEAEFARLNRDYTVTKAQYTSLVERLGQARLSEEAEAIGSIRFEVIDPPTASFRPVSPKRSLLLAGVLLAGLAGGAGLAYLLSLLKPIYQNARALSEDTGLKVLGSISLTFTKAELARRRAAYIRYSAAAGLLLVMFFAVLGVAQWLGPVRQRLLGL